jgi:iron complex outermembrane receptor protein
MVSKRPQAEAAREVQLQWGNFGRKQVAVDFTGPLDAQGQWLYRLVAMGRDSGTQVDYVPDDRMLLAPSLTWRPNTDTSLNLQFHRQKDKSGSLIEFFPWQGTLLPSPFGQIPTNRFISEPGWDRYDTEQTSFGWQFSHRLNDRWTVRQNFRSTDASADYFTIYTSFTANAAQGRPARPVFNADQQSVLRDIVVQLSGSKVRALDNQAEARFATGAAQHTLLLGADFQATETSQRTSRSVGPSINVYAPVYGNFTAPTVFTLQPGVQGRQTGLYAQDQIKWGRWVAQLGLRHDRATLDTEGRPALAADDKATTKRAGLVYLAGGGFAPYVSYSESFLPLGGVNAYGDPYKPQRGKQWEAGLKWEPAGGRTTFMAAVYDLRDTNRRTADPANPLNNLQVGEIRAKGYELEAKTQFGGGWTGSAGYAYTNARISRSNGADQGKRLASVPDRTASLWVMRSMALGAGALSVGGGARYVSESWDGNDSLRTPPFTLLDAMVAWDAGPWRLALNVNNLTDKVHVTTCLARGDCFYGQRRTAVATVRYSF